MVPGQGAAGAAGSAANGPNPKRLYVGNLHHNVQEKDLRDIFAPFGSIEFVQMHMDVDKGFAFVQYQTSEAAKMAMGQLNGLEIAGRAIKVNHVTEPPAPQSQSGGGPELDDNDEGGGLNLSASSRAMLMQKLQRGDGGDDEIVPCRLPAPMPRN